MADSPIPSAYITEGIIRILTSSYTIYMSVKLMWNIK